MPHEIGEHDTMVSNGGIIPWHKLGNVVTGLSYEDVLRVAGIDWEVDLVPVYVKEGDKFVVAEEYQGVRRSDTERLISIVGSDYETLQNSHGLEFLRVLMDTDEIVPETAGSLRNNRFVWVCVRIPREITIGGEELVPYMIFSTGHDGKHGPGVTATPVRPVCNNTIQLGEMKAVGTWRTRHVGNIRGRVAEARQALRMGTRFYDAFEAEVNGLMLQAVTTDQFEQVVKVVVPIPDSASSRMASGRETRRDKIRLHWIAEPDNAWGALNAVNSFELWDRPVVTKDRDRDVAIAERQARQAIRGRQRLTDAAYRVLVGQR